jgi:hypothetical protein
MYPCEGGLQYPHALRLVVAKGNEKKTSDWRYNRTTLSLEDTNTGTWYPRLGGLGVDARLTTLLCKKIVTK